ncbi:hypothetical protein OAM15_02430 [Pelagibacteraceae bacterium]|nr:hypothetical protein [Pelagibacteraceae bacterium]|tara:strand:+ start:1315 stop:1788 length:474 start_codon:yes stop_codon:yes gene_type:complete
MLKILKIFSIFFFLVLLASCGYKKINQQTSEINIANVKINIKNKSAYNLRNNILLISNNKSENKYNVEIEVSKIKTSKIKNESGKTTRYNININTIVDFISVNNLKTISKTFVGSGDYDVGTGHSETVSNEKNTHETIIQKISDEITTFIALSLNNK